MKTFGLTRICAFLCLAACSVMVSGLNAATPIGWRGKQFKISPNDTIYIEVTDHKELSGTFDVGDTGILSVGGIGVFKAAGENAGHLSRSIAAALSSQIPNPEVDAWIVWNDKVYILGEVRRPGPCKLNASMSVTEAIDQAGGLTNWANKKRISVQRGGAVVTRYQGMLLQSGDVIFVP